MNEALSVVVLGASGYTGAEVLRWCLAHPRLRVVGATSVRHVGVPLASLWPQFHGFTDIVLSADAPDADVAFFCLPHGEAARRAPSFNAKVLIDLSGDHRLPDAQHARWYGSPREGGPWAYGLPELGGLAGARRIANPGCFATALALALLPFRGRLPPVVHATGLTGSTGSGATPQTGTHHPSRAENLRPYRDKVLKHQHSPEVEQALGGGFRLQFVPISAPVRRGILVSIPLPGATLAEWATFYAAHPLVRVLPEPPDLHGVLGSPRADLSVVEGEDGEAVVFCAIDNLCRGAGSQAVANLNLAMGWPVDLGLRTIPPVP